MGDRGIIGSALGNFGSMSSIACFAGSWSRQFLIAISTALKKLFNLACYANY